MHRVSESCSIRRCSMALEAPLELSTEAAGTASAREREATGSNYEGSAGEDRPQALESCKKEFRDRGSRGVRPGTLRRERP